MLEILSIVFLLLSSVLVFIQMPYWMKFFLKIGKFGIDIHKEERPKIPEMCGISIMITVSSLGFLLYYFIPNTQYLAVILTAMIGGFIGLIDDLVDLGGKIKPILTLLASIPILILGQYDPHPSLPFIPSTRLTILYPILIPIGIAITTNAVNMLNVINGATPLLLLPILLSLSFIAIYFKVTAALPIIAISIGAILAFYIFNKYPAKAFMGNVGDFFLGAFLGAIAIVFKFEIFVLVAMLPYIMNGFYVLSSVRRLFEHKEIKNKPVIYMQGKLYSSPDPSAPMTLLRLVVLKKPIGEKQAAQIFFITSCCSSILAIITMFLTTIRII